MWEFKDSVADDYLFGCLNPACKKGLGSKFQTSFFLLIGYCLKYSTVSLVSIGLAAHTNRFNVHYQRNPYYFGAVLTLLALFGLGSFV
jgi:hypothetical protein